MGRLHRLGELVDLCYPQSNGSGSTDCITRCSALNLKIFSRANDTFIFSKVSTVEKGECDVFEGDIN